MRGINGNAAVHAALRRFKNGPSPQSFAAYDKSMHSIFITNGLGICSADGLLTCDKRGCCISLQHANRERERARERETHDLSDPTCFPSMHRGGKEQGPCHRKAISFDSAPWEVSRLRVRY